jgi:hypothetical protein
MAAVAFKAPGKYLRFEADVLTIDGIVALNTALDVTHCIVIKKEATRNNRHVFLGERAGGKRFSTTTAMKTVMHQLHSTCGTVVVPPAERRNPKHIFAVLDPVDYPNQLLYVSGKYMSSELIEHEIQRINLLRLRKKTPPAAATTTTTTAAEASAVEWTLSPANATTFAATTTTTTAAMSASGSDAHNSLTAAEWIEPMTGDGPDPLEQAVNELQASLAVLTESDVVKELCASLPEADAAGGGAPAAAPTAAAAAAVEAMELEDITDEEDETEDDEEEDVDVILPLPVPAGETLRHCFFYLPTRTASVERNTLGKIADSLNAFFVSDPHDWSDVPDRVGRVFLYLSGHAFRKFEMDDLIKITSDDPTLFVGKCRRRGTYFRPQGNVTLFMLSDMHLFDYMGTMDETLGRRMVSGYDAYVLSRRVHIVGLNKRTTTDELRDAELHIRPR